MNWSELFERATAHEAEVDDVTAALAARREQDAGEDGGADSDGDAADDRGTDDRDADDPDGTDPSPARVVADADVLAADLLVGGDARRALDHLREHSWAALVASDPLLDDAEAVVADLADADLAGDWRRRIDEWRAPADHPAGDNPALASAYRGGAMHVLTFDDRLRRAKTAVAVRERVETSIKHPKAFAALFDAESLHREVVGDEYPGPDRDPRA